MKYQGASSILATINIACKDSAFTEAADNEHVSAVVSLISRHGSKFDVLVPNAFRSIDDIKMVAFETVTGIRSNDLAKHFTVKLENLEFISDEEFILCVPIADSVKDIPGYKVDELDVEDVPKNPEITN
jgi:hypothetical protein